MDARLELVVGGRIVATATRRRRGGDVTVFDAKGGSDGKNGGSTENEEKEASLLRADVNNWGGHPRAGTSAAVGPDGPSDDDDAHKEAAYASRGARGEAFTISGLRGSFDRATVLDATGVPRHVVVAHATPGSPTCTGSTQSPGCASGGERGRGFPERPLALRAAKRRPRFRRLVL